MFKGKLNRSKPTEVFTPKRHIVNDEMYITRPNLEKELSRAIDGTYHIIIHGESGSGKTWLYKKVLKELDCEFISINLPNASSRQSISEAFTMFLNQLSDVKKVGYNETKAAELNAVAAKGSVNHTTQYELVEKEPFLQCLEYVRRKAKKRKALIVFENLEAIFEDANLMRELGNLILLLDDDIYAAYDVKFLIVGTPSQIKEYFSNTENAASISNRLEEIPEVEKLDKRQVESFVQKGFVDKLHFQGDSNHLKTLKEDVYWSTLGIPQRMHEYCLKLAYALEDNDWELNENVLKEAQISWINQSFTMNYSNIELLMNSNETRVQRKNQVLFALGQVNNENFKYTDIEEIVKKEFPSTSNVKMNISQVLSEISSHEKSPIKKTIKGDSYTFIDPKIQMCLRLMLIKTNGKVEKLSIK